MNDRFRHDFNKLNRLPPYLLSEVTEALSADLLAIRQKAPPALTSRYLGGEFFSKIKRFERVPKA